MATLLAGASLCVSLAAGGKLGSSAALLSIGTGQLGVAWGVRSRAPRHTSARLFAPMPVAIADARLLLFGSVTVAPLRPLLSTHELPPTIWGLDLLTALAAYGFTLWLRPRTL